MTALETTEKQEIELFVHASGRKPQVVLAAAEETLGDALRRLELLPAAITATTFSSARP